MKKILMMLMICLGVSIIANAQVRRDCPVYGTDYTAEIKHGYTLVKSDSYGKASVSIKVSGPESKYGTHVTVFVNVLDQSNQCIAGTGEVNVYIKEGESSGQNYAYFTKLSPDTYYLASINSASCQ